jgi:hypothetical protein
MLTGVLPFQEKSVQKIIQNHSKGVFFHPYLSLKAINLLK